MSKVTAYYMKILLLCVEITKIKESFFCVAITESKRIIGITFKTNISMIKTVTYSDKVQIFLFRSRV